MHGDKTLKNVVLGIVAFLIIFGAFRLANLEIGAEYWLITILLILIYFEILDVKKK